MATGPCQAGFAGTHCYIYLGRGGRVTLFRKLERREAEGGGGGEEKLGYMGGSVLGGGGE
jgi:hypothetical protein